MGDVPQADQWLDELVSLIEPKLEARGFAKGDPVAIESPNEPGREYDDETCRRFLSPEHISDRVLERANIFFGALVGGPIGSLELVEALDLKGPTSIPANLTNPLKKSARRLGLADPWQWGENDEGTRTIWSNRDDIAQTMKHAISAEMARRERHQGGR